jgi:SAM-dependent methyltransferase
LRPIADIKDQWDSSIMRATYDTIGINYSDLRKPDPRIAAMISTALGQAKTVLNVGAGTGSYEPADRHVTAVEPSLEMIGQRDPTAARAIQGKAEDLPFDDDSFDGSMAILTVHHWANKEKGLKKMRRVTHGPVVVLTFDPAHRGAWLNDYFPELTTLDEAQMPQIAEYESCLGPVQISPVPVPHDCTDGFCRLIPLDIRIRTICTPMSQMIPSISKTRRAWLRSIPRK